MTRDISILVVLKASLGMALCEGDNLALLFYLMLL